MGIEDSFILPLIVVAICKADFSIIFFVAQRSKSPAHGKFSRLVLCSQVA